MAADIFTKSSTDKVKRLEVCRLVNIVDKDVFYDLIAHSHAPPVAQTAGGGTARDQSSGCEPVPGAAAQAPLPDTSRGTPTSCTNKEVQMATPSSSHKGQPLRAAPAANAPPASETPSELNVPRSGRSDASRRETPRAARRSRRIVPSCAWKDS